MKLTDQELIQNLSDAEKSFRLMALEQILTQGCSKAVLEILEKRKEVEEDDECLLLIRHAVSLVAVAKAEPATIAKDGLDAFTRQFFNADPAARLDWLERTRGIKTQQAAKLAPLLLAGETHPAVAAMIIRIFTDIWPEEKLDKIVECLRDESVALKLAALQALVKRSPKVLEKHLPGLLLSSEPRARALAVQGLAAIDMDEAVDHLEFMFLQGTTSDKHAALRCVGLLPFDQVCECLLRFVAAESDTELVRLAGLFFQINPDPETPYRLWEVLESSVPEKAVVVRKVVREVCTALEAAEILSEPLDDYKKRLQNWIYRRTAARFVQQCLYRLPLDSEDEETELVAQIQAQYGNSFVKETFWAALDWPLSAERKETLKSLLAKVEQSTAVESPQLPSVETFLGLEPRKQIPAMAAWKAEAAAGAEVILKSIFAKENLDVRVRSAALRTASRLEIKGFTDVAQAALNETSQPALVAAALDYLGRFSFDLILPMLGKFLNSPVARVKTAALSILQREDLQTAVSSLVAMIRQGSEESRLSALNCLVHFDFSLIRSKLCEFIEQSSGRELLSPCLCLFEANPDPENLYALYRIEKKLPGDIGKQVADARERCETLLIQSGRLEASKKADRIAMFASRWQAEQKREQAPVPAYSLRVLRPKQEESVADKLTQSLVMGVYRWRWIVGTALFVFMLALVASSIIEDSRKEKPVPMEQIPKKLSGMVDSIDLNTNRWRFVADDGEVYLLSFQSLGSQIPPVGVGLELTIVPKERLPGGDIVAEFKETPTTRSPE